MDGTERPNSIPQSIKYARLQERNDEHDGEYRNQLRALYSGGKALLRDREILEEVFPRHAAEDGSIYKERCRRAYYVTHAAAIIGSIADGLSEDPIRVDVKRGDSDAPQAVAQPYKDFFEDLSSPGGKPRTAVQLSKHLATEVLIQGSIWTLLDFPERPDGYKPGSLADEERDGLRRPYVADYSAECVTSWELDDDGEPVWVMTFSESRPRDTIEDSRTLHREVYTYYTSDAWGRYIVEWDEDKGQKRPEPGEYIALDRAEHHTCERVPIRRLAPESLWAMDRLESICREYLNKSCGLSWAEYKVLFAQLYEFLAPEMPGVDTAIGDKQQDPDRATRQRRGPGYVQERGHEDRAEYVSPDTAGFAFAAESKKSLRDDMYQQMLQMALSQDNSASSIKRTAESKQMDKAISAVILASLGHVIRDHMAELLELIAVARGDDGLTFNVKGLEKFDPMALVDIVDQSLALEGVSIPSPTFQQRFKSGIARRVLGDDASPGDLEKIDRELESNITADTFAPLPIPKPGTGDTDDESDGGGVGDTHDQPGAPGSKLDASNAG